MTEKVPNTFGVKDQANGHVHITRGLGAQILPHAEAVNLAAHLIARADPKGAKVGELIERIRDELDAEG